MLIFRPKAMIDYKYTQTKKLMKNREKTQFHCDACSDKLAIHLSDCFKKLHSVKIYKNEIITAITDIYICISTVIYSIIKTNIIVFQQILYYLLELYLF